MVIVVFLCHDFKVTSIDATSHSVKPDVSKNTYDVPPGSTSLTLLFKVYINDLNKAISFSKLHHFVHDTNFPYDRKALKDISKNQFRIRITNRITYAEDYTDHSPSCQI